ncbi:MAG: PspA/IM30 family protein [Pseudomonadota bacterium]
MFKQIMTLMRGAASQSSQEFVDRHALLLLQQQIRDSVGAVKTARHAVAVAIAQNRQEKDQHQRLVAQIEELEARATIAIQNDEQQLARETAECLAHMIDERDDSETALAAFHREIEKLKARVRDAETRLRSLQRGERLAKATDRTQRLRQREPVSTLGSLTEAEETLTRLRQRQDEMERTEEALAEMESGLCPQKINEKLAKAGCGKPLKTTADMILERLSSRQNHDD